MNIPSSGPQSRAYHCVQGDACAWSSHAWLPAARGNSRPAPVPPCPQSRTRRPTSCPFLGNLVNTFDYLYERTNIFQTTKRSRKHYICKISNGCPGSKRLKLQNFSLGEHGLGPPSLHRSGNFYYAWIGNNNIAANNLRRSGVLSFKLIGMLPQGKVLQFESFTAWTSVRNFANVMFSWALRRLEYVSTFVKIIKGID